MISVNLDKEMKKDSHEVTNKSYKNLSDGFGCFLFFTFVELNIERVGLSMTKSKLLWYQKHDRTYRGDKTDVFLWCGKSSTQVDEPEKVVTWSHIGRSDWSDESIGKRDLDE